MIVVLVAALGKVPQQPVVQLLFVQRGLEVDDEPVAVAAEVPHMRAGGEHQRPADAEVGEQQLPLLGKHGLVLLVLHRQRHVPQREPLHGGAVRIVAHERDERRPRRDDRVSRLPGEAIAVAGAARRGIGNAAGGDDHRLRRIGRKPALDARKLPVAQDQRLGPIARQSDAEALQLALQRGADVEGAVGDGIDPLAALDLERDAEVLKKPHRAVAVQARKGAVEKAPALRHMGDQLVAVALVRHVAPALAGDIQLLPEPLVRLEQGNGGAHARSADRRHHPGGSAADHSHAIHLRSCQKSQSAPRPAPAPRSWRRRPCPSCARRRGSAR